MLKLSEKAKVDNAVMRITKVSEIRHVIAHTSHGDLCLMLPFKGTAKDYRFVLDAIPFVDKENQELIELFNGYLYTI